MYIVLIKVNNLSQIKSRINSQCLLLDENLSVEEIHVYADSKNISITFCMHAYIVRVINVPFWCCEANFTSNL